MIAPLRRFRRSSPLSLLLVVSMIAATLAMTALPSQADSPNVPVTVTVTPALNNVTDGFEVTINVNAASPPNPAPSSIYGIQARICKATADIQNSADFAPTQGGNCTSGGLSTGTDGFKEVGVDPPNQAGSLDFVVGVGSDTYEFDGDPNYTITCDATHPCNLVAKLLVPADQSPGGQSYKSFPINYAGAATAPGAPTAVTASAGNAEATVAWSAPAADGGSPITSYTAVSTPGSKTCTWTTGPLTCAVTDLTNGTPYTFKVKATNAVGDGPLSAASSSVTPIADTTGSLYHPLVPGRVLDSRPGPTNVGAFATPWGPGVPGIRDVQVGGLVGVPADADAVVLNVTVVNASAGSFLQLWPTGSTQPTFGSSLNYSAGQIVPNAVTVKLGTAGKISVFNKLGNVDVIADVSGYYKAGSGDGFTALTPGRVLDSRPGPTNVGAFATPWGPGVPGIRDVQIGGLAGVPTDADAVVLNVTVVNPTAGSFLQLWPTGATQPTFGSSLNYNPGQIVPNQVTVKLGTAGKVSVFNKLGNVDVIADVSGYYKAGSGKAFFPIVPGRVLDSRPGPTNVGAFSTPWGAGVPGIRDVQMGGLVGVPADADGVVLNVTVVNPTAGSFLQLWPTGATQPTFGSSLNYNPGQIVPNAVTVKLGTAGKVSVFNKLGNVDVIADIAGYFR